MTINRAFIATGFDLALRMLVEGVPGYTRFECQSYTIIDVCNYELVLEGKNAPKLILFALLDIAEVTNTTFDAIITFDGPGKKFNRTWMFTPSGYIVDPIRASSLDLKIVDPASNIVLRSTSD